MDGKSLSYFLAVARQQSFTRAAEQLGIAQPAVSVAIRKLEQQLEVQLFHRHERQVSLTDEGRYLLKHAQRIVQALAEARLEMAELKGLTKGEVRVGIPSMLGSYYFPPILMAFKHRYPHLNLVVIEAGTWQLQQMIEQGELDLGVIVAEFVPEHLQAEVFLREQMLVTLGPEHPLASHSQISLADFFAEELVMFKQGYFHRKVVDRLAQAGGYQPQISFETNLLPLIKAIVKQGFGISTLLQMAVADEPEILTRPFADPVWLDLSLAWRRGAYLSRANQAFVDFVLESRRLT
ncbi:LysR family transcriptional regulator [Balneatrix alpica]|uniref:LysR family transcriptional regulator n=1 Tax=Balneatrix alpica TaxID=75684 RepID=UPI002739C8CE|nr:LysR family transcriptional regulator [Balneatrix alpica]